ncbi:hypothetical protein [Spirosoma sp.]|uniref:hypothetical protein n=1 Tax=Spirosoma sp. TaxID=1899569 RepID=UPI0026317AC4|nr:hypothetical protein [Spirosoma sp.]MCX6219062.1 hypothetical protein [Spirosoma sp.]
MSVVDFPISAKSGWEANLSSHRPAMPEQMESNRWLKRGIWLYFWLLILEGALRKWVLPGLATPLLVVRDPIALMLIIGAWRNGQLRINGYMLGMVFIGLVGIYTAIFLGHGNLTVALFGARIVLFHFPLMFVIGAIFEREDVIKLGKMTVLISVFMSVLIAIQFYSPQSAFVNRGVGGDMAGAGFDGAMGYFRPPGTFSFTNGLHLFFGFAGIFIFYFWVNAEGINRLVLLAATAGVAAAVPFSISRSLLLFVAIDFGFVAIAVLRKPQYAGRLIMLVVGALIAVAILSQLPVLQAPIEAFVSRFTSASDVEGGLKGSLGDRWLGGLTGALNDSFDQPFWGYGQGMGTNAGSTLLTGGSRAFLISEGEWGRVIGELGPLLGLSLILIRVSISLEFLVIGYKRLIAGDFLPWVLIGYILMMIPQAQWAQPTALGFSTMIGGLFLASLHQARSSAPGNTQ